MHWIFKIFKNRILLEEIFENSVHAKLTCVYIHVDFACTGFSKFSKIEFCWRKFLKIRSYIKLPWGHARSHKKFWPDHFDVYCIHMDRQTNKHQSIYIYYCIMAFLFVSLFLDLFVSKKCQTG